MIVNRSMFPVQTGFNAITKMQERMSTLQVQLATGEKAQSLAEMGNSRPTSLSMRSRLSSLEGYKASIETVNLRLDVMDNVITRLDAIEADQRTSATPGAYGTGNVNLTTVSTLSQARLDEVVSLLNTDINGRYLFSGGEAAKKPLASIGAILDGEAGRAGFKTVVSQRKAADAGNDGLGRLDLVVVADTVTLTEDGVHPFGFKLSTLSTDSANITLTLPAGSPAALGIEMTTQPLEGQKVTLAFTLPDGTQEAITLTAVTGAPGAGEFQIGAATTDTATSFGAALNSSLAALGSTKLASASSFAAADNFFNGQGETVLRVDGPPYDTATALIAATPANTVLWYTGGDSATPRQSVAAKIDDSTVVNYGVQGNEDGLAALVKSLAVLAVETFPSGDATSKARFDALASRQLVRLSEGNNASGGSIEVIAVELGMARATAGNTRERHATYAAQMESLVADIEQVSKEAVAMEILALQTRLAASYTTTAALSQLSLVNYLR